MHKMKLGLWVTLTSMMLVGCSSDKSLMRTQKFRVIQLGDSHTAGDYFTNALRRQLQLKLGNGGIGLVPPNSVRGQRTATVEYGGYGWNTFTSRNDYGDFPMGGMMASSANGTLSIAARQFTTKPQHIILSLKPARNGQRLNVIAKGKKQEIQHLAAGKWQTVSLTANLPFSLTTRGNYWEIGAINIENASDGGAVVSALGINGSQLTHTGKWKSDWIGDLSIINPNVIVLAYGTNESFNDNLNLAETEQEWRRIIKAIRKQQPKSHIVLLGAPEVLRSTAGNCGTRPMMLDAVQAMQARLAKQEKILFWSWEKAMGGRCSMKSWIKSGLASKDGVHFTAAGYETVAKRFAHDILKLVR